MRFQWPGGLVGLGLLLIATNSHAQIVFGNAFGEMFLSSSTTERVNFNEAGAFESFQFHVMVDIDFADDGRPGDNASNGVSGWEAEVDVPAEITVTNRELNPVGSTNAGADDNFLVTTASTLIAATSPFAIVTYTAQVMMAQMPEDLIITLGPSTPNAGNTATPNWIEAANGDYHPMVTWDSRFVVNCVGESECGGDISEPLGHLYLSSMSNDRIDFNEDLPGFAGFTMHLIAEVDFGDLGREAENGSNGINAWEAAIDVPAQITVAGTTFQPFTSLNFGDNENFIVGTGAFIRANQTPFALAEISCFVLSDPSPKDLVITLGPSTPSSRGAGVPLWLDQLQGNFHPFATAMENRFVANCDTEPECDSTPVAMVVEDASFEENGVVLRWRTHDSDASFSVHRREGNDDFRAVEGRLEERAAGQYRYFDPTPRFGRQYQYRIQRHKDGRIEDSFLVDVTTPLPQGLVLEQNSPNPFNPQTTIAFALPRAERVTLDVFDARGRWVVQLFDGAAEAGEHEVTWDGMDGSGRAVGSGTYYYRLQSPSRQLSRPMVLLR